MFRLRGHIGLLGLLLIFQLSVPARRMNGFDKNKPEPPGWYSGDIHVHRSCNGGAAISTEELASRMAVNKLSVISVLADMGNSQSPDRVEDLQKVNGADSPDSKPEQLIHYTAEWHWDADEVQKPHQAMGGHLVLLGLDRAEKIWEESAFKVLDWAHQHQAICGFAHMQYLNDQLPGKLSCCIPVDYPVEAALGTIDFISEDCSGSDSALKAYYRLLNCGFRIGLAAGTDYPCNGGAPFGSLLTYSYIPDENLTYRKWIEAIRDGRTVISRNGHEEFIELRVNKSAQAGDVVNLKNPGPVVIEVKWTGTKELTGDIEIVCNGKIIGAKVASIKPGESFDIKTKHTFDQSGWICARRMNEKGHQSHTAPVYVIVNNQPIRANAEDANYFIHWIDNILTKIAPGGLWSSYYTHDLDKVVSRYKSARDIYKKISLKAQIIDLKNDYGKYRK